MIPYSLSDLRTAIDNPKEILREVNRLYYTKFRTWDYNPNAPNIFKEDWDNLLILDACRYDSFKSAIDTDEYSLPGKLKHNYSRGASTREFLGGNLEQVDLSDTVYVTGTTMLYRNTVVTDQFDHNLHQIVDVWEDAIDIGEWGIRPDRMFKAAKETNREYSNKRLVVHFIQPHIPFIGEFGREKFGNIEGSIWRKQRRGQLDADNEDLWKAYMENLYKVLPTVRDLLTELPGKNVVTADHGQFIGERGFPIPIKDYGHPNGIYADELVKVPWHIYQNGSRKKTVSDYSDIEYEEKDRDDLDEKAEQHLKNLGYLQE